MRNAKPRDALAFASLHVCFVFGIKIFVIILYQYVRGVL